MDVTDLEAAEGSERCSSSASGGPRAQACDCSSVFCAPLLLHRVAAHLGPNEVACLRSVNSVFAEAFGPNAEVLLSQRTPTWAFEEHWAGPDGLAKSLVPARKAQLVRLVASSGVIRNLEIAFTATGLKPQQGHLEAAARADALDVCVWLTQPGRLQGGGVWWTGVLWKAAKHGRRRVCEWCLESSPELRRSPALLIQAAQEALRGGHAGLADWLLEEAGDDGKPKPALWRAALEGCDLETARRHGCPRGIVIFPAAERIAELSAALRLVLRSSGPGWRAKAEWLLAQQPLAELDSACYVAACSVPLPASSSPSATNPALERLEWLHAQGCPPRTDGTDCTAAVAAGNLAALRWLREHGRGTVDPHELDAALATAARAGHLGVLQALQGAGLAMDLEAIACAAEGAGQEGVRDWARSVLGARQEQQAS